MKMKIVFQASFLLFFSIGCVQGKSSNNDVVVDESEDRERRLQYGQYAPAPVPPPPTMPPYGPPPTPPPAQYYPPPLMTPMPTQQPTNAPTTKPTVSPSASPSSAPSAKPSASPSALPSASPSASPSAAPSASPSSSPSRSPTNFPSRAPSVSPSQSPSNEPSLSIEPSQAPSGSDEPSVSPSDEPSLSLEPSQAPSGSDEPSFIKSRAPSVIPSQAPSNEPSLSLEPSQAPSGSDEPSFIKSRAPSDAPSEEPSEEPSSSEEPTMEEKEDIVEFTVRYNDLCVTLFGIKGLRKVDERDWEDITAECIEDFFATERDINIDVTLEISKVNGRKINRANTLTNSTDTGTRTLQYGRLQNIVLRGKGEGGKGEGGKGAEGKGGKGEGGKGGKGSIKDDEVKVCYDMEVRMSFDEDEIQIGDLATQWLESENDRTAYVEKLQGSNNDRLQNVDDVSIVTGKGLPPSSINELVPLVVNVDPIEMTLFGIDTFQGATQGRWKVATRSFVEDFVSRNDGLFDVERFTTNFPADPKGEPRQNSVIVTYDQRFTFSTSRDKTIPPLVQKLTALPFCTGDARQRYVNRFLIPQRGLEDVTGSSRVRGTDYDCP